MITKRIIPCLDIKDGRTVKGINFINLRDAGDPVELASRYTKEGADELVFLDISATNEQRKTLVDLVRRVGEAINIPYSVGGGISTLSQAYEILKHGAEKISINSAAVKRPELAEEIANEFGSQCLIVAVDAKKQIDTWIVFTHGGRVPTSLELFDWVKSMENAGAGEILFTSMDHDGTKGGFALNALKQMNEMVSIPVIASGGAGTKEHFKEVFLEADADAALAASIFHYNEIPIMELKDYLSKEGISIRI